jgi:hypothetical protein
MFFIYIIYLALLLLIALNSSFIVIDMFESIFWNSSYLNFDRISYYTVKDSFMFTANYLCLFRSSPSFCWAILLARFSSDSIWFIWSICSLKIGLLFESASYSYSYLIYFLFNFSFCQLYLMSQSQSQFTFNALISWFCVREQNGDGPIKYGHKNL